MAEVARPGVNENHGRDVVGSLGQLYGIGDRTGHAPECGFEYQEIVEFINHDDRTLIAISTGRMVTGDSS